jgi:hypothetical protein
MDLISSVRTAPKAQSKINAGVFALENLKLPGVAGDYADAALELEPDSASAKRLLARAQAAA